MRRIVEVNERGRVDGERHTELGCRIEKRLCCSAGRRTDVPECGS